MSIDPLWREQLNWSPYHYCGNNPVNGRDGSGLIDDGYAFGISIYTNEIDEKRSNEFLSSVQKINEKEIKVGAIGLNIAGTILTGGSLAGAETAGSALIGVFGVTSSLTGAITSSLSLGSELAGKKEMAEKVDKGFSQIFAKGFGASEKTEKWINFGVSALNLKFRFDIKTPGTLVSRTRQV